MAYLICWVFITTRTGYIFGNTKNHKSRDTAMWLIFSATPLALVSPPIFLERMDSSTWSQTCWAIINLASACVLQLVSVKTASEALSNHYYQNTAIKLSMAVCIYITGLCTKLPGCVGGHPCVNDPLLQDWAISGVLSDTVHTLL